MSRGHAVRKSDLDRVLKALRDAGQSVRQIEMPPDGGVLIVPTSEGPGPSGAGAELGVWRARSVPSARLKGLNKVTVRLADRRVVTYWYAWKGGPVCRASRGDPEFIAALIDAAAQRKAPSKDTLASLVIR